MLNILGWNINQKGDETPSWIYGEIKKKIATGEADIIVLTEFYKNKNHRDTLVEPLEKDGYVVFLDPRPRKNKIRQVLIAIRNNLIKNETIKIHILDDNEGYLFDINKGYPNYLQVDFSINSIPLSIIGTRIRIGTSSGAEEHKRRQTQFDNFLKSLPIDRHMIIVGDFNIADHYKFKTEDRENWHYIDNYLKSYETLKMSVYTPEIGNSPINSEFKLDHLILSNPHFKNVECYYHPSKKDECEWDFKGANNPDHAMLLAKVDINNPKLPD
ncbi:endonuclease/exonuclease/phosphatase family protein [Solibacillus sp.]|uniref:endonuclease/exonuclease/phosphatase family protein n=1 Tax=Solibacillus sp. TaxID=1909654 RepID=UPI0033163290